MNKEKIAGLEEKISKEYSNTTGMVVLKDGETLYEKYFHECTPDNHIHVYSVTKSVISILMGIAIDKGYIKSVKQKVLDFFPDYRVKKGEKTIQNVTLENLLTMTAPYKYRFMPPYIKYFTSDDRVTFTLDLLGGRGKIGTFRYAPLIGPDILSGILVKATGQSVLEFAKEHLFEPLGIHVSKNIVFESKEEQMAFNESVDANGWVSDGMGINAAGWGLTLSPLDMAKIGQLYLDNGIWNGKQIVSKEWVKESTREHSRFKKQDLPYGYLWWLDGEKGQSYAAMGDGGNIIYVNREKGMVVSIACLFQPKAKDRIELIKKYIEPIFEQEEDFSC